MSIPRYQVSRIDHFLVWDYSFYAMCDLISCLFGIGCILDQLIPAQVVFRTVISGHAEIFQEFVLEVFGSDFLRRADFCIRSIPQNFDRQVPVDQI